MKIFDIAALRHFRESDASSGFVNLLQIDVTEDAPLSRSRDVMAGLVPAIHAEQRSFMHANWQD